MKVLCFGDSNTFGYDPRDPLGGRYPAAVRWTDILARETGWEVLNAGMNGREIPCRPMEVEQAAQLCRRAGADMLNVMLGDNDLLCHPHFTAEDVAAQMEAFLRSLPAMPTVLIAPPPLCRGDWGCEERLLTESARLAQTYANLARRLGVSFADGGAWNVELAFDGVHFSQKGHAAFATGLIQVLQNLSK